MAFEPLNRYPIEPTLKRSPDIERWHTALIAAVNELLQRTLSGAGSPEGVVTASQGRLYERTDGGVGTTIYYKSSGGVISQTNAGTNTGWLPLT